jgi:hypothetical protein
MAVKEDAGITSRQARFHKGPRPHRLHKHLPSQSPRMSHGAAAARNEWQGAAARLREALTTLR